MCFRRLDATLAGARAARTVGVVILVIIVVLFLLVVFLVVIVARNGILNAFGQTIAVQSLGNVLVLSDRGKKALVDGLTGIGLLHNAKHTVVEMLVEFLSIDECDGAGGASTRNVGKQCAVGLAARWALLTAVGRILLNTVDGSQMPLEDICAIKALLCRRAATRAKATNHSTLVVSKGVSVLVILSCKSLDVIFAGRDWALLWPLVLVSKHMCLEVLEDASALREWAHSLLARLIIEIEAAATLATSARVK